MARSRSCCTRFVTGSHMHTRTTQMTGQSSASASCRYLNTSMQSMKCKSGMILTLMWWPAGPLFGGAFRIIGCTWKAPHLPPALSQLAPLLLRQAHIGPLLWLQFILTHPALHLPVIPHCLLSLTHLIPYLSHPVPFLLHFPYPFSQHPKLSTRPDPRYQNLLCYVFLFLEKNK